MTIHDIGTDPLSPAMTITTEQVVQWARDVWTCWPPYIGPSEGSLTELARLAHEAGRKAGLDEAATVCDDNASACAPGLIRDVIESQSTAIRERINK